MAVKEKSVIIKDGYPCDTCDVEFAQFEDLQKHDCPADAADSGSVLNENISHLPPPSPTNVLCTTRTIYYLLLVLLTTGTTYYY